MHKYLVVIEKAKNNFSAFSPDIWGCIATGDTVEETVNEMKKAIHFHIETLVEEGEALPQPKGISQHIEDGVFNPADIAEEYYITEVEMQVPTPAINS